MAERPLLITIIAILTIMIGLLLLLGGLGMSLISEEMWADAAKTLADAGLEDVSLSWIHSVGYVAIILGLVSVIVGYALWKGWTLAWYLGLILFIVLLASSVFSIISGMFYSVVGLLIYAVLIYYMFTPKVKEFFNV